MRIAGSADPAAALMAWRRGSSSMSLSGPIDLRNGGLPSVVSAHSAVNGAFRR